MPQSRLFWGGPVLTTPEIGEWQVPPAGFRAERQ
jgi:hypothetical protein